MTIQTQDIRDRALRVIAYGSWQDMKKFLAEIDPDGYYPEAEKRNGLWVHIARLVCAKQLDRREPPLGWDEEEPPFDECKTCTGLDMCQAFGFPESVEECELYPEEAPCPVCGGEVGHRINCPRGIAFTGEAAEARRTLPRPRLTEAQERARGELAWRLASGENVPMSLFM